MSRRAAHLLPALVGFVVLFGAWEAIVRIFDIRKLILPAPSAVWADLARAPGYWWHHAWVTGLEALLGFFAALVLALGLAVAMVHSRLAERVILPVLTMIQVTPLIALAVPLFILFRGFGLAPKVVMATLVTFVPFTANALTGLRAVDADALEVLRAVHASRLEVLLKLRIPHALPYLFAAARVGVGLALIGALVAEWSGSAAGLGYVMIAAKNNFAASAVWAAVAVLTALGLVATWLLTLLEGRLLRWHPSRGRN
ncbi:MAG: ABC transporter permease [Acidimicrobiia bacterium]|nr:ABC transporter permease [Acidimicrobiia bacterium]